MYNPMQSQLDAFKKKNPPKATNYLSSYATQVQNKAPTPSVFGKNSLPSTAVRSNTDGTIGYLGGNQQPKQEEPFDYYKSYFDSLDARESAQADKYGQAANNAVNANDIYLNQNERAYKNMEDQLKGQIPVMEKRSKKTQDLIKKGLESVKTQGERSKLNIQEQSGETLRGQAQTKREVDAKRNAIFAGNNTTDSFGVGGYQLEQTNADTDFMREQNMTLRDRDNQLANIETQIMGAETDAQVAIDDEIAKFEDAVRQIQFTLKDNEIAKQNAIENAYIKLQDTLFNITDSYNTNTSSLYEKRLELMKVQQEAMSPSAMNKDADAMRQEYIMRTEKSGFPEVYNAYNKIMSTSDSAAGDMSLIFSYMKLLDPASVVREGEFATAQNSGSVPDSIRNVYNKALSGKRLQPTQRSDFRNEATQIFQQYRQTQDMVDNYYGGQASLRGVDPYSVTGLYSSYQGSGGQPVTTPVASNTDALVNKYWN